MPLDNIDESDAALEEQLAFMAPRMAERSAVLAQQYGDEYRDSLDRTSRDSTFGWSPDIRAWAAAQRRFLLDRVKKRESLDATGPTESQETSNNGPRILGSGRSRPVVTLSRPNRVVTLDGHFNLGGKRRTFKHHKKTKNKKRRKRKTKAKY